MIAPPGKLVIEVDIQNRYYRSILRSFLELDPTWAPEEHARTDALVVATPRHMGSRPTRYVRRRDPVMQASIAAAMRRRERVDVFEPFYRTSDIAPVVQPGDTVLLDYMAIDYDGVFVHEGRWLHTIEYQQVFAAVRGQDVLPVAGNLLCRQIHARQGKLSMLLINPFEDEPIATPVTLCQVSYAGAGLDGEQAVFAGEYIYAPPIQRLRWITWKDEKYLIVNQADAYAKVSSLPEQAAV